MKTRNFTKKNDLYDLVEAIVIRLVRDQKVQDAIEAMSVEDYDLLEDDLAVLIGNFIGR